MSRKLALLFFAKFTHHIIGIKTEKEIVIMMNIIYKLVEWFNITATLSYDEMVFVAMNRLS